MLIKIFTVLSVLCGIGAAIGSSLWPLAFLGGFVGCFLGLDRRFALRYSFLMSIPAILGANVLNIFDCMETGIDPSLIPAYISGVITAAVLGYLSIRLLKIVTDKGRFGAFSYYCWAVGMLTIILSFVL